MNTWAGDGCIYLLTVLDDFSRYITSWKLCTTMKTFDVTDTLNIALEVLGRNQTNAFHKPRLLSDNGASYISAAEFCNALFTAQAIQHNADLLLSAILLTSLTFDVFDDALAGSLSSLSHTSLHEDEDEPKVSLSPDLNLCHGR